MAVRLLHSSAFRIIAGTLAAFAGLTFLRYHPWRRSGVEPVRAASRPGTASLAMEGDRERLTVGFLPVT